MFKHVFITAAVIALTGSFFAATHADARAKVAVIESTAGAIKPGSTYAFALVTTSADSRVANDIVQERLQQSVATAMAAHGLRRVDNPANAQFLVAYHVRLENRVEPRVSGNCGVRACWGAPNVDIARYTEGVLVLDIVDARTGRLLWRAASDKKVSQKDATQAKLDKMLLAMTKTLPAA